MNVCVLANDEQKKELLSKPLPKDNHLHFLTPQTIETSQIDFNAFFLLDPAILIKNYFDIIKNKPVLINDVIHTLPEIHAPQNFHRINAWPTFLNRSTWEIASQQPGDVKHIFDNLGWNIIFVNDHTGLIASRVIAMIINEAFFALGDNVSTEADIDIAMKLGTNYPYGPFEWAKIIGLSKIESLLTKLSKTDSSYSPAPALLAALNQD